jgi:hypothetical protein
MKNRYEVRNDVTAIFVYTKGTHIETLIDTVDFPKADSIAGTWSYTADANGREYIKHKDYNGESIYLHKHISECPVGMELDHSNGDSLDNRRVNLVACTHRDNMNNQKMRVDNKSGIPCVLWDRATNKWKAIVTIKGYKTYLGVYSDKYEAGRQANLYKISKNIKPYRKSIILV